VKELKGVRENNLQKSCLRTDVNCIPNFEVLLCPVCGFYYVHPVRVKVATGEDVTIVDSKGIQVVRGGASSESRKADTERGVRIILEYVCENGHRGEVILQFHKGIVFVEHNQLPPPMKDWSVIWRT
jgi:hypothetical protein